MVEALFDFATDMLVRIDARHFWLLGASDCVVRHLAIVANCS